MKGPESEIPGITRVTVAPATHTSQAAGHRHQSESRQKQIPRGKQNRQKNHARQRGQHPGDKSQQLVAPGRTSPIQRFGKCRRHAPRTIHGGVTIKIRSRHSDFGYTRHLCSLHNLKGNANDSKFGDWGIVRHWMCCIRPVSMYQIETGHFLEMRKTTNLLFYWVQPSSDCLLAGGQVIDAKNEISGKSVVVIKKQQVLLLPAQMPVLFLRKSGSGLAHVGSKGSLSHIVILPPLFHRRSHIYSFPKVFSLTNVFRIHFGLTKVKSQTRVS